MDTEKIVIRPDHPEDLLAYLPYRFGYTPTESLVVLALLEPEPGRYAIGTAARLDLDDLLDTETLEAVVAGIGEQLRIDGASTALTTIYTATPFAEVRNGVGPVADVVARWCERAPYACTADTMIVGPAAFACLECAEEPCCPPEGRPIELMQQTPVAASMVLAGAVLADSRDGMRCPRTAGPAAAAAAATAAAQQRRVMDAVAPQQQERWRGEVLDDLGLLLAAARTPAGLDRVDPGRWGRIAAALSDPHLRDVVVVWALHGFRLAPATPEVLEAVSALIQDGSEPPDVVHLDAATTVLTQVARHAEPGQGAHPIGILGWLAWWRGDGARAHVLSEQALEESATCGLGQTLAGFLDAAIRPGWAMPRPSVTTGP